LYFLLPQRRFAHALAANCSRGERPELNFATAKYPSEQDISRRTHAKSSN
jgi:hypothetical protein